MQSCVLCENRNDDSLKVREAGQFCDSPLLVIDVSASPKEGVFTRVSRYVSIVPNDK